MPSSACNDRESASTHGAIPSRVYYTTTSRRQPLSRSSRTIDSTTIQYPSSGCTCPFLQPINSRFRNPCPDRVSRPSRLSFLLFFFNDTATTEIYTLSLHDALPICHLVISYAVFC